MVPLKIVKRRALIYYTAKRVWIFSLTLSRKLYKHFWLLVCIGCTAVM